MTGLRVVTDGKKKSCSKRTVLCRAVPCPLDGGGNAKKGRGWALRRAVSGERTRAAPACTAPSASQELGDQVES